MQNKLLTNLKIKKIYGSDVGVNSKLE